MAEFSDVHLLVRVLIDKVIGSDIDHHSVGRHPLHVAAYPIAVVIITKAVVHSEAVAVIIESMAPP